MLNAQVFQMDVAFSAHDEHVLCMDSNTHITFSYHDLHDQDVRRIGRVNHGT